MKKYPRFSLMAFLIFNTLIIAQNNHDEQQTGDLTVLITGLKKIKGSVQIALYNSEESYNNEQEEVFRRKTVAVEKNEVTWIVSNIAFGNYAIKTFHDENKDGLINKNFLGVPTEKYGFSNNAKGRFGPPAFEKARFSFNPENVKLAIKLH